MGVVAALGVALRVAPGVAPGWVEGWWPTGGSALDGSPRHSPPPRLPPKPCKQAHDKDRHKNNDRCKDKDFAFCGFHVG